MLYYKYTPLVRVTVMHGYYHDKLSRDFTFTPFPSTVNTLSGFGLIPRLTDGRLLLYQQQEKNGVPVQAIDRIIDLFFTVRITSDILNITRTFKPDIIGSLKYGKYWLSNLNDDGTYSKLLSVGTQLGKDDTIHGYDKQKTKLYFKKGTISEIEVKKIFPDSGKQDVNTYTIDAAGIEQEIKVTEPGLYFIEKILKAGGREITRMILHDELESMGDFWSVLHLQLKPGDGPQDFELELQSLKTPWRYIVLESKNRPPSFNPANLAFNYTAGSSRYPAGIIFNMKTPGSYPALLKKEVDAIKSDSRIKEVYVFESDKEIELVDGPSPVIEIKKGAEVLAKNISIPTRAMKETKILYKL